MFKELFLTLVIVVLLLLVLCYIKSKSVKLIRWIILFCLVFGIVVNILYNAKNIFPEVYIDTVDGHIKYADMDKNLFSYDDEFIFPDQIIFPILRNRTVYTTNQENPYYFFLEKFSENTVEIESIDSDMVVANKEDFDFSGRLACIWFMDYIRIDSESLNKQLEEKKFPQLYINVSSLENCDDLIVTHDSDFNMYIMSLEYYNSLNGVQE